MAAPNYPRPAPPPNVTDRGEKVFARPLYETTSPTMWTWDTFAGHTLRQALRLIRRGRGREIIGGELTIYDPRELRAVALKAFTTIYR